MCLKCLERAMKHIKKTEGATAGAGGAPVATLQAVHHAHCQDPDCQNEGHCHLRARRTDGEASEWVLANGTKEQCAKTAAKVFRHVGLEFFEELYEADERGLCADALALLGACAVTEASGECHICFEEMDCADINKPGGFRTMQVARLPCGHTFHLACYTKWALKHTTCPTCRRVVDVEGCRTAAAGVLPAGHKLLRARAPLPQAPKKVGFRARLFRALRRRPRPGANRGGEPVTLPPIER